MQMSLMMHVSDITALSARLVQPHAVYTNLQQYITLTQRMQAQSP